MTITEAPGTDHSRATAEAPHSRAGVPATSRAARHTSFDLATFPAPTGREEEWRFSPLSRLASVLTEATVLTGLEWNVGILPTGVTLTEIDSAAARTRSVRAPGDRASAIAASGSGRATLLAVAPGAKAEDPITITIHGGGGDARGHLLVELGQHAEATVVIHYSGTSAYSDFVSLNVGTGARLTLVIVDGWEPDAVHASEVVARLAEGASLKASAVTLGGAVARINASIALAGEGADVALYGLYFADAGQHQEHRVFVDHVAPRCRSRVTYKGALAGATARTVWIGDVLIRAEAEGTNTYELNRNLVLSDGARADSVPNLEIETGEIEGAGHASATGRFDDEQMFYLRSRGIPEGEARRLVVRGFFADLIRDIGVPSVERDLVRAIERELEAIHD